MLILVNRIHVEVVEGTSGGTIVADRPECLINLVVIRCTPLEERSSCFDVDLLDQTIPDSTKRGFAKCCQICGRLLINCDQSCAFVREFEIVKITI